MPPPNILPAHNLLKLQTCKTKITPATTTIAPAMKCHLALAVLDHHRQQNLFGLLDHYSNVFLGHPRRLGNRWRRRRRIPFTWLPVASSVNILPTPPRGSFSLSPRQSFSTVIPIPLGVDFESLMERLSRSSTTALNPAAGGDGATPSRMSLAVDPRLSSSVIIPITRDVGLRSLIGSSSGSPTTTPPVGAVSPITHALRFIPEGVRIPDVSLFLPTSRTREMPPSDNYRVTDEEVPPLDNGGVGDEQVPPNTGRISEVGSSASDDDSFRSVGSSPSLYHTYEVGSTSAPSATPPSY